MYIIDSRPTSYIYVIVYMCGPEFFDISCLIEIYMSETHKHTQVCKVKCPNMGHNY